MCTFGTKTYGWEIYVSYISIRIISWQARFDEQNKKLQTIFVGDVCDGDWCALWWRIGIWTFEMKINCFAFIFFSFCFQFALVWTDKIWSKSRIHVKMLKIIPYLVQLAFRSLFVPNFSQSHVLAADYHRPIYSCTCSCHRNSHHFGTMWSVQSLAIVVEIPKI